MDSLRLNHVRHVAVVMISLVIVLGFAGVGVSAAQQSPTIIGELRRWHPMQLSFAGENACEVWNGDASGNEFNPFLHRRLVVTFTNGNKSYTVPGFFNAGGEAAFTDEVTPANECGNQWAVRFTPDETGTWNYTVSYREGTNIALSLEANAGTAGDLNGIQGSFNIQETNKSGLDFRGKGLLRYVNEHYPRFDNGEYYIKTGSDSPENFLGYVEFHNTFDHEIRSQFGPFIHTYETHAGDYNANPGRLWGVNRDKGQNIYGALNYLSSVGVNSVYMINYGIDGGDSGDVWAWSCPNALVPNCDENKLTFDISKLEQWELVFQHMDKLGIQNHFVFTEMENDDKLSETQLGLYYREMVARFAHHNAVIWNLGEENQTSDTAKQRGAAFIRAQDPYNHRITVHTLNNRADTYYDGLLGDPNFEATSIQQRTSEYNRLAIDLRERSADAGRKWIIYGDEQPDRINSDLSNWSRLRRQALWGNLMGGGGGIQWYIAYQSDEFGDVNLDNFRLLEEVYLDSAVARQFFEERVPDFWQLEPDNDLVRSSDGTTYALAQPGETYALYVEKAGALNEVDLRNQSGSYSVGWYSVRTGRFEFAAQPINGGSWVSIGQPPFSEQAEFNGDSDEDYAVVILRGVDVAVLDVNNDDVVTPADAVYVINRVGGDDMAADVNGDNSVTEADVQAVIAAIGDVVPD